MNNLLLYLIQSGLSLTLLYAIYWVFMRKDTFFMVNRLYLMLSAIFSFLIPLLEIRLPFSGSESSYVYLLEAIVITPDKLANSISSNLSIYQILGIIYLTGVAIFTIRLLFQFSQIALLVIKYGVSKHDGLNIVFTLKEYSPFSFFNLIFLSNHIKDNKQLEKILKHEQVHIQQVHSVDLIILELVTIIQWFNPIIWFYKNTLKSIHEFQADQGVLAKGFNKRDYQDLLLNQTFGIQVNYLSNNLNKSLIKRRLKMMSKSKTQNFALLKMAFILPLAMVLAIVFSASVSERIIAQESISDKELKSEQFKQQKQESDVYTEVEKMPEYPGGDDARIKFLVENIKYPAEARKNGVRGTVFVTFIVEKDGEISNVKALKGIGGGCDEEAVRVISMMPNWKPGMQKGKPVRVQFNMPIKFNLDNGGEKEVKKGEEKKEGVPPPPPKPENKKSDTPPPPTQSE